MNADDVEDFIQSLLDLNPESNRDDARRCVTTMRNILLMQYDETVNRITKKRAEKTKTDEQERLKIEQQLAEKAKRNFEQLQNITTVNGFPWSHTFRFFKRCKLGVVKYDIEVTPQEALRDVLIEQLKDYPDSRTSIKEFRQQVFERLHGRLLYVWLHKDDTSTYAPFEITYNVTT